MKSEKPLDLKEMQSRIESLEGLWEDADRRYQQYHAQSMTIGNFLLCACQAAYYAMREAEREEMELHTRLAKERV